MGWKYRNLYNGFGGMEKLFNPWYNRLGYDQVYYCNKKPQNCLVKFSSFGVEKIGVTGFEPATSRHTIKTEKV